jgi:hypothetical protein
MIQDAEEGGIFEFIPNAKDWDLSHVAAIVQSDVDPPKGHEHIQALPFAPGTLSVFKGHQSLHRVTEMSKTGGRDRYVAVLTFSHQEGDENSESVREMFWGRPC